MMAEGEVSAEVSSLSLHVIIGKASNCSVLTAANAHIQISGIDNGLETRE